MLNRIQHKHIVQFLGAVTDDEHFKAIVLGKHFNRDKSIICKLSLKRDFLVRVAC